MGLLWIGAVLETGSKLVALNLKHRQPTISAQLFGSEMKRQVLGIIGRHRQTASARMYLIVVIGADVNADPGTELTCAIATERVICGLILLHDTEQTTLRRSAGAGGSHDRAG